MRSGYVQLVSNQDRWQKEEGQEEKKEIIYNIIITFRC